LAHCTLFFEDAARGVHDRLRAMETQHKEQRTNNNSHDSGTGFVQEEFLRGETGCATCPVNHTFHHVFAIQLPDDGYGIHTVQELLVHKDVRTTMIDTPVLNRGERGVRSPADGLARDPDERYAGS